MSIASRLLRLSCGSLSRNLFNGQHSLQRLQNTRSVSLIPLKRFMKEEKFAKRDKAPEGFKIIYRAPMEYSVKAAKLIAVGTVTFMSTLAMVKLATDTKYIELTSELNFGPLIAHDTDLWPMVAGFAAINGAILLFVAKYPLRIYKKDTSYLAIYDGFLPFTVKRYSFDKGQVREAKHRLNPWSLITFKVKDRLTILLLDYFKTASEFHEMCEQPKQK